MSRNDKIVVGALRSKDKERSISVSLLSEAPKDAYIHDVVFLKVKNKDGVRYAAMTPAEAVILGIYLIRASSLADVLIASKKLDKATGIDWATDWQEKLREQYSGRKKRDEK